MPTPRRIIYRKEQPVTIATKQKMPHWQPPEFGIQPGAEAPNFSPGLAPGVPVPKSTMAAYRDIRAKQLARRTRAY